MQRFRSPAFAALTPTERVGVSTEVFAIRGNQGGVTQLAKERRKGNSIWKEVPSLTGQRNRD